MEWIFLLIIIIIIIFVIWFNYKKINNIKSNLEVCSNHIIELLNKKTELLLKLNKEDKNKDLESSLSFEDNISLFEKEKKLFNITVNIDENFLKKKLKKNKKEQKSGSLLEEIKVVDDNLEGLKDYYNTYVNLFNSFFRKKPFIYIYKIFNLYEMQTFESKRTEKYEILKS